MMRLGFVGERGMVAGTSDVKIGREGKKVG